MDLNETAAYIITFLMGGGLGSLLTIKISNKNKSDSNQANQKNIKVTNGDNIGRDKHGQ